jgi:hypothetical protein
MWHAWDDQRTIVGEKNIKEREGKQNNKQEMQKIGGGRGYMLCKQENCGRT